MSDNLVTITNEAMLLAHTAGMVKMKEQAATPEAHWYPCGFAWACIKMRKNHRLAKVLRDLGWRWDDYYKHYYTSMPSDIRLQDMWQSMDYAARCLRAYAEPFKAAGIDCYVNTRID